MKEDEDFEKMLKELPKTTKAMREMRKKLNPQATPNKKKSKKRITCILSVKRPVIYCEKKYHQDKDGYYFRYTRIDGKTRKIFLHRQIWIDNNGQIPFGHHIHHIDLNPTNNNICNLQCVSVEEHARIHNRPSMLRKHHMN